MESIEIVRDHARRVKYWSSSDMALRWAAAGMTAAEAQFRRVKGYRQLPALARALERAVATISASTRTRTGAALDRSDGSSTLRGAGRDRVAEVDVEPEQDRGSRDATVHRDPHPRLERVFPDRPRDRRVGEEPDTIIVDDGQRLAEPGGHRLRHRQRTPPIAIGSRRPVTTLSAST